MPRKSNRIRANSYLLAQEVWLDMLRGLGERRLVTQYVLHPAKDDGDMKDIEFEVRVTRIGDTRMPRSLKGLETKS